MKRKMIMAMVAAMVVTSAAGVGVGGYMMGHNSNKVTATENATAGTGDYDHIVKRDTTVKPAGGSNAVTPGSNATVPASNAVAPASNAAAPASNAVTPASNAVTPASNAAAPASKAQESSKPREYTVTPANYVVYCTIPELNVRTAPEVEHSSVVGSVTKGQALQVTGEVNGYTWLQVNYNGKTCYVSSPYVEREASGNQQGADTTPSKGADVTPAPSSDTTPSKESADAIDIHLLDGWGLINTNIAAGRIAGEVQDILITVSGHDDDGNTCEMKAVDYRLEKLLDSGDWMRIPNDEILEAGNTYRSAVTVVSAESAEKTVTFKPYLALSMKLQDSAWSIERIECDAVTLHGNAHTV